jgi:hypothetical protein
MGPYEVLSVFGTGGMAEVYRARDTRLGREISLRQPCARGGSRFRACAIAFERLVPIVGAGRLPPQVSKLHDTRMSKPCALAIRAVPRLDRSLEHNNRKPRCRSSSYSGSHEVNSIATRTDIKTLCAQCTVRRRGRSGLLGQPLGSGSDSQRTISEHPGISIPTSRSSPRG